MNPFPRRRCLAEEVGGVSERSGAAMESLPGGGLLLHGGECLGVSFGDCFVSSPLSSGSAGVSFAPLALSVGESPTPRANHSLCLIGSLLVLFGGTTTLEDGDTVYHNDVWTLSPEAGGEKESGEGTLCWQWSPRQSNPGALAPSPRSQCATVALSPRVGVLAVDTLEANMRDLNLSHPQEGAATRFFGDVLIYGGFGLMEDEGVDEKMEVDEKGDDEVGKMEVSTSNVVVSLTESPKALPTDLPPITMLGPSSVAANTDSTTSLNDDINNVKDDEVDDDDDGSVAEGYLGDCWLLDSSSGAFCEVFVEGAVLGPTGGCAFSAVFDTQRGKQDVVAFGGFDGEAYSGHLCTFSTAQIMNE